jgi:uncharacterized protein YycO
MAIPLDPGIGGRSVGGTALAMGDLLVSTTPDRLTSLPIRIGTGSPVSHARLYIGGGQVVEAVGSGVVLAQLSDAIRHDSLCVAYRVPNLNTLQAQMARDFAGMQLGRRYNYVGIGGHAARIVFTIFHPITGWIIGRNNLDRAAQSFNREDQFFCSQLVLAAFVHAGIRLTATEPSWNTPGDVANLRLRGSLEYVGHLRA